MKLNDLYSGSWDHVNFKPNNEELPEHYKEEYFYDDSNYCSDPFENPWDSPKPFGMKRSASDEEIKKKYRELILEHHPDKGEEIKKKYRELILEHHPDKGGDEEKFKSVQAEWEEYQCKY
jgi:preprotein translocase subunit Sec63